MSLVALDLYAESSVSVCDVECAHGLRTFRLRHVTHDRGFGVGAPPAEGPLTLPLALWPGSGELSACGESSDMAPALSFDIRQMSEESRVRILGPCRL
jgi:hypothetical protein